MFFVTLVRRRFCFEHFKVGKVRLIIIRTQKMEFDVSVYVYDKRSCLKRK